MEHKQPYGWGLRGGIKMPTVLGKARLRSGQHLEEKDKREKKQGKVLFSELEPRKTERQTDRTDTHGSLGEIVLENSGKEKCIMSLKGYCFHLCSIAEGGPDFLTGGPLGHPDEFLREEAMACHPEADGMLYYHTAMMYGVTTGPERWGQATMDRSL